MGTEITTTIAGLDKDWPLGADPVSKGDDHIRLIKDVLKTIFPGTGGAGFSTAILADETELNYLQGVTSAVQTQITANADAITALQSTLPAPTGTVLVFYQSSAPTGWTQDTTKNDYMMRIVSTAGGGSGGSSSPITAHTHTGPNHRHTGPSHVHATSGHTLTTAEMPAHTHNVLSTSIYAGSYVSNKDSRSDLNNTASTAPTSGLTSTTGSGSSHSHGNTGSGGTGNTGYSGTGSTGSSFTPKYINTIICEKD